MLSRPYIRRRSRRLLSFASVIGIGFLLIALQQSYYGLWRPLVWGFEFVLEAEGAGATIDALTFFVMANLAPFALAVLAMALLAFTVALVVSLLLVTLIPVRFQGYLDGVVAMVALVILFEGLGLAGQIKDRLGGVGTILFYWAVIMSTSHFLWKRLPFGLSYTGHATRIISMPMDAVANRLLPGRDPSVDLADIDILNRPPGPEEKTASVDVTQDNDDGLAFSLHHVGQGTFVRDQRMHYKLTPLGQNETEMVFKTSLSGLAPMSFWDFWSRNFAQDYADHIEARLLGRKDASLYGFMQAAARRKLDKANLQTATA